MRRAGDMTEQPKFLEPGAGAQEVSNPGCHWTTTLPEDLLKEQSLRLQLFYAVGVILWAINCAMGIGLAPHGDRVGPAGGPKNGGKSILTWLRRELPASPRRRGR